MQNTTFKRIEVGAIFTSNQNGTKGEKFRKANSWSAFKVDPVNGRGNTARPVSFSRSHAVTAGNAAIAVIIALFVITFILGIGGCFMYGPDYRVYEQSKAGEAMLAHAKYSKEVAVAEARAKAEAAELLAQAEIKRAEGVAKANQIIGQSLKDNEAYLRYLWINGLESNNPTVVYIPTEAGLPILEAGRRPTSK